MKKHVHSFLICLIAVMLAIMTAFTVSASSDPPHEGEVFKGWSMNDDEANLYEAGSEIGMNNADDDYTVKLKAEYGEPPDAKYAVSIYGIKQDYIQDPNKVGALTFGPATGENYTKSFKFCDSPNCIHNLTWDQIIQKANNDPTVFESCLKNGCTKSIELQLSDNLIGTKTKANNLSGDGASGLYNSINYKYRNWNFKKDTTGGWNASRIRTTLNGKENCEMDADESIAGNDILSTKDSLISAFPEVLQNGIVSKAVKECGLNDIKEYEVTYDKLWLFNVYELGFDDTFTYEDVTVNNLPYQKVNFWIEETNHHIACKKCTAYNETGTAIKWATRSFSSNNSIYTVYNKYRDWLNSDANDAFLAISPGFCVGSVNKN